MKIYGYESDDSDLISLNQITLQLSLEELNVLMDFLKNSAKLMKIHDDKFGHQHLSDFYKKGTRPDIIISQ